jgi:hypothetical protein
MLQRISSVPALVPWIIISLHPASLSFLMGRTTCLKQGLSSSITRPNLSATCKGAERIAPYGNRPPIRSEISFRNPFPSIAKSGARLYKAFLLRILPYPWGNIHPRFRGWVAGTGTPLGMLAEMLAAGFNSNVWGGNHVAGYVEVQVLNWLKEIFGFSTTASGLLVSGGSMANLLGLTVACNARTGVKGHSVFPSCGR